MARKRGKQQSRRISKAAVLVPANDVEPKERPLDATPERLSKGDASEFVNPALIDSKEQQIGNARRFFKRPKLDRWHRAELITQRQWWAGSQYRALYERSKSEPRVVGSYGERTTGGEPDYGLARTDAQARARRGYRDARANVAMDKVGVLDRLVLKNDLPRYGGRKHENVLAIARSALDQLADHFERGPRMLIDTGTLSC